MIQTNWNHLHYDLSAISKDNITYSRVLKKFYLIIGMILVSGGLIMFFTGLKLVGIYESNPDETRGLTPPEPIGFMTWTGIPIALVGVSFVIYGVIAKFGYILIPTISAFLIVMWIMFLISRG
ncbi:MAG: hypothetical protein ACRDFC_02060 [Ignavibacteria bacterium]